MVFSYRVGNHYILENVFIPLEKGSLTLLTGVEGIKFSLIGGIVSGLFPVEERDVFPSVEELVKYFTGELRIREGNIPSKSYYIGPDPEKHLLFSRVYENP